jgi:hypothetical protein
MFCFSRGTGYFKEAYRPREGLYQPGLVVEIKVLNRIDIGTPITQIKIPEDLLPPRS